MKRIAALLLCVWLAAAGVFAVSADSTTSAVEGDVTQTEIITQTTIYYEEVEVEVVQKVHKAYPDGTALALILFGGLMIVLAIALLCIYLFAFPRWGLVESVAAAHAPAEETPSAERPPASYSLEELTETTVAASPAEAEDAPTTEDAKPSTMVSLEDLF